jgi:hypothetical protein
LIPREPIVETTIFLDRFDMMISLLQLERDPHAGGVDVGPEGQDVLDRMRGG